MKRIILLLTFLLICGIAWGAPTSTTTRPYSYTTGAVVDADKQNSNENTIYNAYNAHTHEDLTKTSSRTWTLGNNTDVDHRFIADNSDTNNPELRYESDKNRWQFSNDGVTFKSMVGSADVATVRGVVDGFDMRRGASPDFVLFGAGSLVISTIIYNTTSEAEMSVASDWAWIGGSASDGANDWIYTYAFSSDTAANIASFRFSTVAPDAVDEEGNTGGVNKFYSTGGTTYRCIGAVRNDANADIASFSVVNNTVMWGVPVNMTTTPSTVAWSSALDCSAAIPAISTLGIFGLQSEDTNDATAGIYIRPNGTTWSTPPSESNGIFLNHEGSAGYIGGQRTSMTDSSQQIQYWNDDGDEATIVDVEGYIMVGIK